MPGLPGAACTAVTSGSRASADVKAWSRPPEPMTRTFTCLLAEIWSEQVVEHDGRVTVGAHADRGDAGTGHVLECLDVLLSVGRQVGEGARLADVLPPTG